MSLRCLGNKAIILRNWGRLEEAIELHKKEQEICEELGNKDGLQACLGNQALILRDRGYFEEAWTLLKKQQQLCEELGNTDGLSRSLMNQAIMLAYLLKRPSDALSLTDKAYRIAIDHGLISLAEQIKQVQDKMMSMMNN